MLTPTANPELSVQRIALYATAFIVAVSLVEAVVLWRKRRKAATRRVGRAGRAVAQLSLWSGGARGWQKSRCNHAVQTSRAKLNSTKSH